MRKAAKPFLHVADPCRIICSICGYVYDPAENGGVALEDLPEDRRCPRCRQGKEKSNAA
ncbi:MAG: rubredoxin [Erysipelotrichaceae bacterium]|nr:rubredoxin [Erysipelotrichaceae bacterium]